MHRTQFFNAPEFETLRFFSRYIDTNCKPPVRAYFFKPDFSNSSIRGSSEPPLEVAIACLLGAIKTHIEPNVYDYVISGVWIQDNRLMLDLFAYRGFDTSDDPHVWPGTPSCKSFVIRNGVLVPDEQDYEYHGGSKAIMGVEEEYRSNATQNLKQFLQNPPSARKFL
jgi:hypothetical protein